MVRRRLRRRISNAILIPLLSGVAAYFITRQTGAKYHVFIDGANHMSFISAKTSLPGRAAQGDSILGYTNAVSLAFWDAYLKADSGAKNYLQSNALPDFSHSSVRIFRR